MSPKDVQCHRLAAEVHRRLGHIDEAVDHLETAVGLDPGDRESTRAAVAAARGRAGAGRGRRPGPGAGRRHVRDARLRRALPRAGAVPRKPPGVHPHRAKESRSIAKRAIGWRAALRARSATERVRARCRCRRPSSRRGCESSSTATPYTIVDFQHVKPGKGGAFVRTKLKHMKLGKVIDNTFRSGEKVELVDFEEKHMQFLYSDDRYNFMDTETYEQVSLSADEVGDARDYLKENIEVDVLYIDGSPASGRAAELRRAGHRPHRPGRARRHGPGRDQARHAGDRRRRPGSAVPERGRRREGGHAHRRLSRPRRGRRADGAARRRPARGEPAPGGAASSSWRDGSAPLLGELGLSEIEVASARSACACSAACVAPASAPPARRGGGRRAHDRPPDSVGGRRDGHDRGPHGRDLLPGLSPTAEPVRERGRPREGRPDPLHHRGDEAHERDRVEGGRPRSSRSSSRTRTPSSSANPCS